jgi:hypothetical protein
MPWPNFLIIGAQKGGTTVFESYIEQHPEMFVADRKELNFFAFEGQQEYFKGPFDDVANRFIVSEKEAYLKYFQKANHKAIGESSVIYLYHPEAPARIKHHIPQAKLIAILRNPIDRAFSAFMHLKRDQRETAATFEEALALEPERIRQGWETLYFYRQVGKYAEQLERYFRLFDRKQIKVFLYDELKDEPQKVIREAFEFLNVSTDFQPDMSFERNASGLPRVQMLNDFFTKPNVIKSILKPVVPVVWYRKFQSVMQSANLKRGDRMNSDTKRELEEFFTPEISRLSELLNRDLSFWLKAKSSKPLSDSPAPRA